MTFFAAVSLASAAATIGDFFPIHWDRVCCDIFFSTECGADFFSFGVDAFFSMTVAAGVALAATVVVALVFGDGFVGNTVGFSIAVHFRSDGLTGDFDSVFNGLALTASTTF